MISQTRFKFKQKSRFNPALYFAQGRSKFAINRLLTLAALPLLGGLIMSSPTFAQDVAETEKVEERNADECFKAKDKACLDELFSDVIRNPSDNKKKAAYLLGVLHMEDGNAEAAKDNFVMSLMFSGTHDEKSVLHLKDLYEGGKVEFDTTECLVIEEDACFQRIIDGDDVKKSRAAQYHLGTRLYETDPKRSFELLKGAVEAGHKTAVCELQKFYADDGDDGVPMDYHKSVNLGFECLFNPPFKKFNKDYFAKYEKKSDHKAYAHSEGGFSAYASGISSPEMAATLAVEYCKTSNYRKPDSPECKVINVDDRWIKDPGFAELIETVNGVDDLITTKAVTSYEEEYMQEANPKVFVQSAAGAWTWRSRGGANLTLEELKTKSLASCNSQWMSKTGHKCKVVNVNGEWVD